MIMNTDETGNNTAKSVHKCSKCKGTNEGRFEIGENKTTDSLPDILMISLP